MDNVKITEALKTEKVIGEAAVEFTAAILENKKSQEELVALKDILIGKLNSYLITSIANKNTFAMELFANKVNGAEGYNIVFTEIIESRTEHDIIDWVKNIHTKASLAISLIDKILPSIEDGGISEELLLKMQDARIFNIGEHSLANIDKQGSKKAVTPNNGKTAKNDKILISIDREQVKQIAKAYEEDIAFTNKLLIGTGILLLGSIGYLAYKTYTAEDATAAGIMDQGFAPIL